MKTLFITALLLSSTVLFAQDTTKVQKDTVKSHQKVFTFVEQMPKFPGGTFKYYEFMRSNCKYSILEKASTTSKKVYANFIVEKDGSLADIRIMRSDDKVLSDEIMRVLKLMPKWIAGTQNGKAVDVYYNLQIIIDDK